MDTRKAFIIQQFCKPKKLQFHSKEERHSPAHPGGVQERPRKSNKENYKDILCLQEAGVCVCFKVGWGWVGG